MFVCLSLIKAHYGSVYGENVALNSGLRKKPSFEVRSETRKKTRFQSEMTFYTGSKVRS